MATPKSQLIVDNLVSAFTSVRIRNGYSTDVAIVEKRARTNLETAPDRMPYVAVFDDGEETATETPGVIWWIFDVHVIAYLQATSEANARTGIYKLASDLRRAAYVDVTRGANPDLASDRNAIWTKFVRRSRIFTPDPTVAGLELMLQCKYAEGFGDVV